MMTRQSWARIRNAALCGCMGLAGVTAGAETLAPGVEYDTYTVSGPNKIFVVKFERARPEYDLVLGFPFKQRSSTAKETTSAIQSRYDSPPGHDVLAAVNGSFFGSGNDITGDVTSDSSIVQLPDLGTARPSFAFMDSGECRIATRPTISDNQVHFADTSTLGIDIVNEDRITDTMVLYTSFWGASTTSTVQGTEVVLSGVNFPMRPGKEMSGTVTSVGTGASSLNNAIPAGGAVLSARDSKATTLAAKAHVGDRITWSIGYSQAILNNAQITVNGAGWIVENGAAKTSEWTNYSGSFTGVNPRTMVAWNATHVFLIVIDGRQAGYSVGMTFTEMANFCINTLQATDAINLDGGGSSTMVVNGVVKNQPSDGSQRAVGDAVMLVKRGGTRNKTLADSFPSTGRQLAWDDKFRFNNVQGFSPTSPGGDGTVMVVSDPTGGFETTQVGERMDTDCVVEADLYLEYRSDVSGDGYERCGIFARDQGQRAFDSSSSGGGNCYMMMYNTNNGRLRAGKVVASDLTDFREANQHFITESGWHRLKIECIGTTISYYLDGSLFHQATDSSFAAGTAGIAYHEFFTTNSNIHGTRADNFSYVAPPPGAGVETWMLY